MENFQLIEDVKAALTTLKDNISYLGKLLNEYSQKSKVITQSQGDIVKITNLDTPYSNFYYDDEDLDGNKVNTYYGYICCDFNKTIVNAVILVNTDKLILGEKIKTLRFFYKSNPPLFNKIMADLDPDGRINIKELTRQIVSIEADETSIKKISFQPEIINKGKGRCLTASEIRYVIDTHFNGEDGKYSQDLQILKNIPDNELLSPISAPRRKCRVNVRTQNTLYKNLYCSIPIIILCNSRNEFKTNLNTIFEKQIRKIRNDQQLENAPLLAFRSFTRKKSGFKSFLSKEELEEREEYLNNSFE